MVSRGANIDVYDGEGGGTNGSAAERRTEVHATRFGV